MAFSYDPTTDRGRVRLLIGDTDTTIADNQVFADADIDAFLTLEDQSVKRAAAQALDAMAASQVMILKVIRLLDLQTDGAAVARELRAQAKALREQADGDDGEFDIAEQVLDPATFGERVWNQHLLED